MPKPDETIVRQVLAENGRDALLRAAMLNGWGDLKEKQPDRAWWRRRATRAALVWEYSVNHAIDAFKDDKGVQVVPHFDTISFIMDDAVLVRLKKADLELKSSNYPTLLASLFHHHDADLFGYSGLQRVEIAYVLNRFQTDMDWVGVVAREGKKPLWHFELADGQAATNLLNLTEQQKPSAARLARLRKSDDDKRRTEEND